MNLNLTHSVCERASRQSYIGRSRSCNRFPPRRLPYPRRSAAVASCLQLMSTTLGTACPHTRKHALWHTTGLCRGNHRHWLRASPSAVSIPGIAVALDSNANNELPLAATSLKEPATNHTKSLTSGPKRHSWHIPRGDHDAARLPGFQGPLYEKRIARVYAPPCGWARRKPIRFTLPFDGSLRKRA